jgi:hypothetical protein
VNRLLGPLVILAAFAVAPAIASANPLGFTCLSDNNAGDCDILEAQMSVELTQTGNWLNFTFTNIGPEASYIDGVYFSDPPPSLLDGSDPAFEYVGVVQFSEGCAPADLPNDWGTTYCADKDKAATNGINPGESLTISYLLLDLNSLQTVLDGIAAGTFDIGIKVQGFASGGSEWGVVGTPPITTPEPGSLLMFGAALATLLPGLRRRRSQS